MIERMGKKSGVVIGGTPKYLHARWPSNLPYAALAGNVHGGLFPTRVSFRLVMVLMPGVNTRSDIHAPQEDGMEPGNISIPIL